MPGLRPPAVCARTSFDTSSAATLHFDRQTIRRSSDSSYWCEPTCCSGLPSSGCCLAVAASPAAAAPKRGDFRPPPSWLRDPFATALRPGGSPCTCMHCLLSWPCAKRSDADHSICMAHLMQCPHLSSSEASRLALHMHCIHRNPRHACRFRRTSCCMHAIRKHLDASAGERCLRCRRRRRRPGGHRRRSAYVLFCVRRRCGVGAVLAAAGARGRRRQRRRRLPGDPAPIAVLQFCICKFL
jgi:hypothetical protein